MTRYDTAAQARLRTGSRRLNLVLAAILIAGATYLLASYIVLSLSPYPPLNAFELVLAILVYCLAAIPLSQAFIRRPHPESVEVREEGLFLRFAKRPPVRIAWEDRPVTLAYDDRELRGIHRRPEGMEVAVYIPLPGRDQGSPAFRPMEIEVSGDAFDEIAKRMKQAGFRTFSERWSRRRPGQMVEFLTPKELQDRQERRELASALDEPRRRSRASSGSRTRPSREDRSK